MKKEKLMKKAQELRRKGLSLREISEKINISKSTASLWLSNVKISKKGKIRVINQKNKAVDNFRKFKKNQKENYLKEISGNCKVFESGEKYKKNDFKIFLALLFWGEGSKSERRLTFMNSDPKMIETYLTLLRSAYGIEEDKLRAVLHLHSYHDVDKQKNFWSKLTKINQNRISIYQKKNTAKRLKKGYQGCISIRYGDVKILDELFLIVERFYSYIEKIN